MKKSGEGHYTITKKRKFLIPATIILFLALVFVGIISLLPNRGYYLGNTNTLGIGRYELFPFVFCDSYRTLYVMDDNYLVKTVDDSVYNAEHDYSSGIVYYMRNSSLFSYSIEKDLRTELCTEISEFKLLEDRKAVVCISNDNDVMLLSISTGKYIKLSENSSMPERNYDNVAVGESHVLFLDNYDYESAIMKADLMISNENGTVTCVAENVDFNEKFSISKEDKYISYYRDGVLNIEKLGREKKYTIENGVLAEITEQPVLISPKTEYISTNECEDFGFITKETDDGTDLMYLKSRGPVLIDEDIKGIKINSSNGYCFYTKGAENETVDLYVSIGGTKPRKIVNVPEETTYTFDELQGYIYFKTPDSVLSRIYVKDRLLKIVEVTQSAGAVTVYKNRPYIVYKSEDGLDTFILLDKNVVERYEENEIRLYGSSTDIYLKYLKNGSGTNLVAGTTSLDLYVNGMYTRIANSVSNSCIFFDKNYENILYMSNNSYYVRSNGVSTEVKMPNAISNVNAVPVIES